jgi:integrase
MAGLEERSGRYRIHFRYHGKQYAFTLGNVGETEARAKSAQVDYLLLRLKQRLIELPPGVDIVDFIEHDGKPPLPAGTGPVTNPITTNATLATLRDRYLATHEGAQEKTSLNTARTHFKHVVATLGPGFPLAELTQVELQKHADRRAGDGIAPVTIRKEIHGLRAAWNWGRRAGLVAGEWAGKGLVYRKTKEKPPFQTRAEIKRRIARGGLKPDQINELWESLYLTAAELPALLKHVSEAARHPFIYPMVCMAAHTGARRSELIRAEVSDVDLESGHVTLREKKRVRGRQTSRRVPLSPFLAGVLTDWLANHPGGHCLFCHAGEVAHSSKRSRTTGHLNGENRPTTLKGRLAVVRKRDQPGFLPLTENEATDHFNRTLAKSEWEMVSGWHTLRHSFASICASQGIDQRLINAWMGHQTAEQQKRYQHLFPQKQQEAIREAFG